MSRHRAVLLVVEGEKAEPRLMKRAFEVYGVNEVDEIYSYRANIYDLYRTMFEGVEDTEDLSLTLVLREREDNPALRELLDREYSDIILIFDFDPQDHLFSMTKLEEMIAFFSESTEHGKLYVNYPMVEAYRDIAAMSYDETFLSRNASLSSLARKTYKDDVRLRSTIPRLEDCTVLVFNQILLQNLEKASQLVGCDFNGNNPTEHYESLTQEAILSEEGRLVADEAIVSVLCTCLWFVIDYRPKEMAQYLRSFSM